MLPILVAFTMLIQSADVQPFTGSWVAQIKGQTFARLELTIRNGDVQGQLRLTGFHVDANGDVDELIRDDDSTAPIFDVSLRDNVLSFSRKDGDDTDRFQMRLADGRATLAFVVDAAVRAELAQEGVAVPRPFTMIRTEVP